MLETLKAKYFKAPNETDDKSNNSNKMKGQGRSTSQTKTEIKPNKTFRKY